MSIKELFAYLLYATAKFTICRDDSMCFDLSRLDFAIKDVKMILEKFPARKEKFLVEATKWTAEYARRFCFVRGRYDEKAVEMPIHQKSSLCESAVLNGVYIALQHLICKELGTNYQHVTFKVVWYDVKSPANTGLYIDHVKLTEENASNLLESISESNGTAELELLTEAA